ncbi:PQQ-dependent sugar dehydrogenase [Catalinimonas niigatensis]|uniref:PQQ-dependent sugar dehydrogenase n=1 Tax=Catalinimonas niigatensis TaxID=1397264 RepID=UPI0026665CFE|nr:PQQ-dependent sugar dehydrogenase [Catalinimonas niigatensis]WPP51601.1 PQQ-dependent sugar dehydrogenase [Catalinimonas niigatensis]
MKKQPSYLLCFLLLLGACTQHLPEERILAFIQPDVTSLADIQKLRSISQQKNYVLDTTSQISLLTEDTIKHYSALAFLQVPGAALEYRHQTDLERYIQAGGGIISIGTDISPQYQWPWYQSLTSAWTEEAQDEKMMVTTISTQTEAPAKPARLSFDGGRFTYLPALTDISDEELAEALRYSIDKNTLDYSRARTKRVPDESRFTRIVLDDQLNEPMELDIMPDGKVIYIERRGNVKLYNPDTREVKLLSTFDVSTEGNYEDGMLGIAVDPKFHHNRRVYIYYSPAGEDSVQRLSRFYMSDDSLIMASEKVVLDVAVQRETCCHSGGSVQFGPDGLLWLSTGDNTSSKESNGYSPLDERPGRGPWDAQKSSGNTHDLRGKILRIKLNDDGTYSIPSGNLFPKDGSKGRPEIYVMGARNPFRISIDWKNNWVYWGDVGPDVGKDGIQGPQSYDEWNQGRVAGNYGWPYFVADNKAYPDWDFYTDTPGAYFDPEKPINASPHNYGSRELPPARPAMISYPYGESEQWPNLGTGSRSAMAGPVYYADRYQHSSVRFPDYYDGKLFIYEWARSWIKVITFDENHQPVKIEPFMEDMPISKPIDMEFGPDGAMYLLEYGANYFADNDEARLVRIEYAEGNRKPVASIAADQKAGAAPLTVQFSAIQSFDYDTDDALSYAWSFTDDETQAGEAETSFTFEEPGVYHPTLKVTDKAGKTSTAQIEIRVGNAAPLIEIAMNGNQTFFYDDEALDYQIQVSDAEDGFTLDGGIAPENVRVHFDYLQESKDLALLGANAMVSPFLKGKNLIDGSDCKSCHALDQTSIGPSYQDVAERYHEEEGAIDMLATKIITGGNGNWGHSLMAAHPQHTQEETAEMVKYILSLADEDQAISGSMPMQGSLKLNHHHGKGEEGSYYLTVNYTDRGANDMPPLSTRKMITLRHPRVQAEAYEDFSKAERQRPNGGDFAYVSGLQNGSYLGFSDIDLTDIAAIDFHVAVAEGGTVEVRLDEPDGPKVAEVDIPARGNGREFQTFTAPVDAAPVETKESAASIHKLYVVFRGKEDARLMSLDWMYFHKKAGI